MNRAFLFDLDGVLIDSEPRWSEYETAFFREAFGDGIAAAVGNAPGRGHDAVYDAALAAGAAIDRASFDRGFRKVAENVYAHSDITPGSGALVDSLRDIGFKIGLVTQSPLSWIGPVLGRIPFTFDAIVSTGEHPDIPPKPDPTGFLFALEQLDAGVPRSIVLEDSVYGIKAGKASRLLRHRLQRQPYRRLRAIGR